MAYNRYRRRGRRFGTGTSRAAVTSSSCVISRKSTCRGCGQAIAKGDTVTRLRLKKRYQAPCSGCGHKPAKLKYFHANCVPADINKAMGYDPAMHAGAAPAASCPPPPKPKTEQDLSLEALSALEAAVIARAQKRGVTPEMEKAFKTFQNVKARVLRPGTPGEGEAATNVALKRIIDLVFA